MTRNLKALGLALFAVLAFGAMAASAASAQQGFLTSDGEVTLTGEETGVEANRLTAFGATVECPGSTYTGHKYTLPGETTLEEEETGIHQKLIPNGATTVTLTPHYKQRTGPGPTPTEGEPNCKVPGLGWTATVHMNGCDYVVHLGETTPNEKGETVAGTYGVTFDIVCTAEKDITVTLWTTEARHTSNPSSPDCVMHVPGGQNNLAGAHATDTGNGHIDLTGTVKGIHATRTGFGDSPLFCPEGTTSTETAKFDLDVTVSGDDKEGKETEISLSHA